MSKLQPGNGNVSASVEMPLKNSCVSAWPLEGVQVGDLVDAYSLPTSTDAHSSRNACVLRFFEVDSTRSELGERLSFSEYFYSMLSSYTHPGHPWRRQANLLTVLLMQNAKIRADDSAFAAVKTNESLLSAVQKHVMSSSIKTGCLFIAPGASANVIVLAKGSQTKPPLGKTTPMIDFSRQILFTVCRKGFLQLSLVNNIDGQAKLLMTDRSSFLALRMSSSCKSKRGLNFTGWHPALFASTAYYTALFGCANEYTNAYGYGISTDPSSQNTTIRLLSMK